MILYKSGKVSVWKAISFIAIAPIAFVLLDAVFNVASLTAPLPAAHGRS